MTTEKYVKMIMRKVQCSGKKRGQLRRQLLADIAAEVESGSTPADVVERMGKPSAVAEEFNQNLSTDEVRRYRRGRRWKIAIAVLGALALLAIAGLWFLPVSLPIGTSGVFDQEEVEAQAKKYIGLAEEGEYEALWNEVVPAFQRQLNAQQLGDSLDAALLDISDDRGAFLSYGNVYMNEIRQQGKLCVAAQVNVSYENAAVTYTLLMDEALQLVGIYVK